MPTERGLQQALFGLLVVVTVALTACSESGPKMQPLERDAVVLAFGDSLTYGTGAKRGQSYPEVLAELIERPVITEAVPGETTADAQPRLQPALDEHQPALVILCLGGNDMLRKRDRAAMYARLDAMISTIQAQGAQVLLLGVPEPKLIGLAAEPGYAALAKRRNVPFEADVLADVLSERALKADPIHPNAEGYRQIAETIAEFLRERGAI